MDEFEFIDLVERMRELQRRYFSTRDRDVLTQSKKIEKQVDDFIKKRKESKTKPTLF